MLQLVVNDPFLTGMSNGTRDVNSNYTSDSIDTVESNTFKFQ